VGWGVGGGGEEEKKRLGGGKKDKCDSTFSDVYNGFLLKAIKKSEKKVYTHFNMGYL
jgi:hypothetical protein